VNLLEALRATPGVRAAVVVTSDKCYENRERSVACRETDPMGGHDPYSSSKGCAELVAAAYRSSFFNGAPATALATARAGNVIGGGDWAEDRLLPDIFRAVESAKPARIRNPAAIRPWQHVLEPLAGYMMLAEKLCSEGAAFAEAWNFGPYEQDCEPVRWIVDRLASRWSDVRWEIDSGTHVHEANYLKLDSSKAMARLGWRPRWDLARALDSIVAWHESYRAGADMRAVVTQQIAQYESETTAP
jgi:CDP-glucose 4,6-dehydratase